MLQENSEVLFHTGTHGQPTHLVRLLDTGHLVLEDVQGNQLYSTHSTEISEEPVFLALTGKGELFIKYKGGSKWYIE